MIELAEVFRRHWPEYIAQFGAQLTQSHRRAVKAIMACGTAELGGQHLVCADCKKSVFVYHSCNHRACPRCGGHRNAQWLENQREKLLPAPYFLLTFTVPEELRFWFQSDPKVAYSIFFREASLTLLEIGANPEHFGAQLGLLAVLHTWTRQLLFHPHLHFIVPGGGLTPKGEWKQVGNPEFFLPQRVLAARFRNRMKTAIHANPEAWRRIPVAVWRKGWVVDCQAAGTGENALKYLARYVGKTALTSSRILADENSTITFSYQDAEDKIWKTQHVDAQEFLRRVLLHVLPSGLQRVRYYGFLAPAAKRRWEQIVRLLDYTAKKARVIARELPECPYCKGCELILIEELPRPP